MSMTRRRRRSAERAPELFQLQRPVVEQDDGALGLVSSQRSQQPPRRSEGSDRLAVPSSRAVETREIGHQCSSTTSEWVAEPCSVCRARIRRSIPVCESPPRLRHLLRPQAAQRLYRGRIADPSGNSRRPPDHLLGALELLIAGQEPTPHEAVARRDGSDTLRERA
jgi:hypothetical protein